MIDLYTWDTPNGIKPILFFEEAKIPYNLISVNISKDEQFHPAFLSISPNNKIPAIVDGRISIFESGAILIYLAEKFGVLMSSDAEEKAQELQWLMWQVGGLGPILGQAKHFKTQIGENYANGRFEMEATRLYRVLNSHLQKSTFVAKSYSIADIMIYPWISMGLKHSIYLFEGLFPSIDRWVATIESRESVMKAKKATQELRERYG